ncbi:15704_t:CDS:2 [Dentiscutata erythropus]|uniref:15704_t:CDS:1 n=1 Tax=Dentiscutata erythropus TaxID=1348616 RepID=A0A9N9GN89_9GLOM|nr:15704_t:CDS:2 [Dentiscutata erythropus]
MPDRENAYKVFHNLQMSMNKAICSKANYFLEHCNENGIGCKSNKEFALSYLEYAKKVGDVSVNDALDFAHLTVNDTLNFAHLKRLKYCENYSKESNPNIYGITIYSINSVDNNFILYDIDDNRKTFNNFHPTLCQDIGNMQLEIFNQSLFESEEHWPYNENFNATIGYFSTPDHIDAQLNISEFIDDDVNRY